MVGSYHSGTADSCYGTQNEQKNTHINVIKGDIRREMTVYTDQGDSKQWQSGWPHIIVLMCVRKRRGMREGGDSG